MMFWDAGLAWWQAGLMWFAAIAFLALLIWIAYALVTGIITRPPGQAERDAPQTGGARRILDERLARGEIEPEEYQRLREALDGSSPDRPAGTGGNR